MAATGSRTSPSGISALSNDSNAGNSYQSNTTSAPVPPNSPEAARQKSWRRKELRKVRSVDLDKPESLLLLPESRIAPVPAQLHFLSASSPGGFQPTLLQQSYAQQSNSLNNRSLSNTSNTSPFTATQELLNIKCDTENSSDYGASGASLEMTYSPNRYCTFFVCFVLDVSSQV